MSASIILLVSGFHHCSNNAFVQTIGQPLGNEPNPQAEEALSELEALKPIGNCINSSIGEDFITALTSAVDLNNVKQNLRVFGRNDNDGLPVFDYYYLGQVLANISTAVQWPMTHPNASQVLNEAVDDLSNLWYGLAAMVASVNFTEVAQTQTLVEDYLSEQGSPLDWNESDGVDPVDLLNLFSAAISTTNLATLVNNISASVQLQKLGGLMDNVKDYVNITELAQILAALPDSIDFGNAGILINNMKRGINFTNVGLAIDQIVAAFENSLATCNQG